MRSVFGVCLAAGWSVHGPVCHCLFVVFCLSKQSALPSLLYLYSLVIFTFFFKQHIYTQTAQFYFQRWNPSLIKLHEKIIPWIFSPARLNYFPASLTAAWPCWCGVFFRHVESLCRSFDDVLWCFYLVCKGAQGAIVVDLHGYGNNGAWQWWVLVCCWFKGHWRNLVYVLQVDKTSPPSLFPFCP